MSFENILPIVVSLCLGVLFNVLLGLFIYLPYRKVAQMRSWSQTSGKVESAEIAYRSDSEGGSTPVPHVVYTYSANGQNLRNDKIQPGGDVGGMVAYRTLKRYTVGAQVPVYYNPENPSEALLERDVPGYVRWLWIALVFVNVMICCCGLLPSLGMGALGPGMKFGLPYLMEFIRDQMTP